MCKNASRKIYASARVSKCVICNNLMNSFFSLAIAPLYGCVTIASIIEKQTLHMTEKNKNKNSSFEELIQKDCSVSIHDRNIQILATKS